MNAAPQPLSPLDAEINEILTHLSEINREIIMQPESFRHTVAGRDLLWKRRRWMGKLDALRLSNGRTEPR